MNKVTAFLSVYPLRQKEVTRGIGAAIDALAENGVEHEIGVMGTQLWGEDEKVFACLRLEVDHFGVPLESKLRSGHAQRVVVVTTS